MSTVEYIIGFLGAFSMDALYYLREMLIIGVPAAIVFACFWPYRRNALRAMGLRTNLWRETGLLLFCACSACWLLPCGRYMGSATRAACGGIF